MVLSKNEFRFLWILGCFIHFLYVISIYCLSTIKVLENFTSGLLPLHTFTKNLSFYHIYCYNYSNMIYSFSFLSQSLLTLNKIEEYLGRLKVPRPEVYENWIRNRSYFRLDGSTSAQEREKLINQFNDPDGGIWAFLLSTK